jgi:uncharacterized coiled-coil protein SlyX
MAAAVDAAEGQKALEAKIREVEKQLKGATGDKEVALQQRLTALEQRLAAQEQQKLLLMQQQSAAAAAAGGHVPLSLELLREPLLEMVGELRVTNTYLRNSACWQFKYTSSQATQHRDPNFKQALIEAYGCKDPQQPDTLFCMGLGKFVPKQLVCGAHLFKYSWRNEVAQVLGFTNINDPANGLLLIKPLEEAFDNGYMCITWEGRQGDDRAQGEYQMLWLGPPELLMHDTKSYPWKSNGKLPSETQTQLRMLTNGAGHPLRFIDLHRKVLTFRTSARPFRRCLVFQARFAAKQALAEGRFNEQQLAEMAPYLVAVSPQASNIEMYWQRMPDEGPDLPPGSAPVEDLVYDQAPESFSDAEDE